MNDVVLNDAMEHVTTNESEFAINRGQSTLLKGPAAFFVVGCIGMRVVQICYGNLEHASARRLK